MILRNQKMITTVTIGNVAERRVAYWLEDYGYSTNIGSKDPSSTEIEGRGNSRSLLVRVKSAVQPNTPDTLSTDEICSLTERAARRGWEAWEARVQLDEQLRQVGEIQWRKLS
jgi:hypothetical protein